MDAKTLERWLKDGSAALFDVREPAEFRATWIPGASFMPPSQFDAGRLPGGRIVIHCQKGGRGAAACEKLLKQNPALEVYIWRAASKAGVQRAWAWSKVTAA